MSHPATTSVALSTAMSTGLDACSGVPGSIWIACRSRLLVVTTWNTALELSSQPVSGTTSLEAFPTTSSSDVRRMLCQAPPVMTLSKNWTLLSLSRLTCLLPTTDRRWRRQMSRVLARSDPRPTNQPSSTWTRTFRFHLHSTRTTTTGSSTTTCSPSTHSLETSTSMLSTGRTLVWTIDF